ncbi:MAG: hypothetical protein V1661_00990 [bacterium]
MAISCLVDCRVASTLLAMTSAIKILKIILKNFLVFAGGGVFGAVLSIVLMKYLLAISITKDVGLGIIALAPVMIIFWAFIFGIGGGLMAIIIYNVIKIWRGRIVV